MVLAAGARNDIAQGLFTPHVAREGRKGRHFVLFKVMRGQGEDASEVLRLPQDAMDLARHRPLLDETGE